MNKLHSDEFATRSPCIEADSTVADDLRNDKAGPYPLKRDVRFIERNCGGERVLEAPRRPSIVPDRFNGKVLWKFVEG